MGAGQDSKPDVPVWDASVPSGFVSAVLHGCPKNIIFNESFYTIFFFEEWFHNGNILRGKTLKFSNEDETIFRNQETFLNLEKW